MLSQRGVFRLSFQSQSEKSFIASIQKKNITLAHPHRAKKKQLQNHLPRLFRKIIAEIHKDWLQEQIALLNDRHFNVPDIGHTRFKEVKSRWGSCSEKKNLNFSNKMLFLPEELQHYLLVHEMAHLLHMNHSKKYWQKVNEVIPDYKQHSKKLRRYNIEFTITI